MGSAVFCLNMRALLLQFCLGFAYGSSKLEHTPMHSGGGRIVGGTDASRGEFPHQIMLTRGVGGSLMCGGSLVAPDVVVTAGHCCDGMSASQLGVEVGSHELYSEDPDQEAFAVREVKLHENYNSNNINNDICLLFLDGEADFSSPNIGPIALPTSGEEYAEGTECIVSGWGTTSAGGSLASTLQKVTVPVVSDDHCRDSYGQSDITDSMICAGLDQGGKDSCQGDSGGPFMCGNQLSGIVSWGYGCAEAGYPGVYTQTSYFIDWIMENADLGPPPTTTTTQAPTEEPTVPTTTLPPFECPSGWVDANPGCFRLEFNSSMTRHEALLLCESAGGFLAEPKSQDQVDMLAGLAQLEFDILGLNSWWIGLTDQGHEGRWVWEHSFTEADFTDWADGFPTAEDNVADCAIMSHDQGWKWVDMACGEGLATAICQMDEA